MMGRHCEEPRLSYFPLSRLFAEEGRGGGALFALTRIPKPCEDARLRNPALSRKREREIRGFTLLEMSIVLAIIGVIIGGGMSIFSASLQKRQLQETQFKMKAIQKALYDFRIINNRLPCPADVTLALNSTNFGVEGATPGSCIADGTYASDALTAATGPAADFANIITTTGNLLVSTIVINSIPSTAGISAGMGISGANIPAGTTVLSVLNGTTISISAMPTTTASGVTLTFGNNVEGMAPVASLHLPDDYALDGWGRRIMYTVDNRFTANGALIPYPNAITMIGNGVLANTMNTLPTTSGLSVGMRVYGPKMPQAETIASITSSTAITLTTAICCTATGYSFTFSTKPIPATAILVTDTTQRMTVNDQSGNPKTTRAAYVLVSFGANGHGAWPRNGAAIGSRISSGSRNADEGKNCDCYVDGSGSEGQNNPTIPAGIFVQEQPNQTAGHLGDPSYYFDDIVAFGTRSDLAASGE